MFDIRTVSSLIVSRKLQFLTKFVNNHNSIICGAVSAGLARRELNDLNGLYLHRCLFDCCSLFLSFCCHIYIRPTAHCICV